MRRDRIVEKARETPEKILSNKNLDLIKVLKGIKEVKAKERMISFESKEKLKNMLK